MGEEYTANITDEGTENKAGRVVQVRFCINGLFLRNRKYIGQIIRIMISEKKKTKEIAAALGLRYHF